MRLMTSARLWVRGVTVNIIHYATQSEIISLSFYKKEFSSTVVLWLKSNQLRYFMVISQGYFSYGNKSKSKSKKEKSELLFVPITTPCIYDSRFLFLTVMKMLKYCAMSKCIALINIYSQINSWLNLWVLRKKGLVICEALARLQ